MRVELQPAYVLHSRPYRDSSSIVDVLTLDHGRLGLMARGARRHGRKGSRTGALQPFVPLLVSFSGRAELKTLGACEIAGQPVFLRGDRLFSGLYLNELLVRLLHKHDPHPQVFLQYASTLGALAASAAAELPLRQFELKLLDELGYNFDLEVDGQNGEPVVPEGQYYFQPEIGMVRYMDVAKFSRPLYTGADLCAIAAGELAGSVAKSAKRLLREVLNSHLGGEPLRSRQLFRAATGLGRSA
jgi:DNA repair protein RecO (recombination protein O)